MNISPTIPSTPAERYLTLHQGNYQPTQEIGQLISKIGETATTTIMTKIMAELLLASGHEVPDPDTYLWLCKQISYQYPSLEMGEWAILLQVGITGGYGPIYGKITLDIIGVWVQRYREVTWPTILQRIQAAKAQEAKAIPAPQKKAVPPPPWWGQKLQELTAKVKSTSRKNGGDKYYSLRDYCTQNEIDYQAFITPHLEKWESDFLKMIAPHQPTAKDIQQVILQKKEALLKKINEFERQ